MFQYKCLNPISQTGLGLFGEEYKQTEELNDADAVLVRSAKMHDMELPENVKVIARAGAGVNNIPVEQCAENGIVVFNTPGANANGVKELVLAGMLLASRDIVGGIEWVAHEEDKEHIDKLAEKQKKQFAGCEISGKKLGIIGLGAIGAMVANSATHLGMEVYGYDPFISIDAAWNLSRTIKHSKSLDEIYSQCDYITIHVPLTDNTRKMIDKEAFTKMKEGVVLLNFARDLLVDEEAVLVRSAKMHDMELPENVKVIARAGAGVNNIPVEQCAENGIVVFNTPGANANGVKELVLAGMLLASRDIVGGIEWVAHEEDKEHIDKLAEKQKKQFAGCEISGKKLGIIGLGAIGAMVANSATHLGMEVYGYDPFISIDAAWNLSRTIKHSKSLDEIYSQCDYITIHVPLTDNTRKMIDKEAFTKMKEGVVLLNFARDLLVDEEALIEALDSGKVKKYVTDFANPLVAGRPGILVTPHLGASTAESEENCAVIAVKEVRDFLENGNIKNSVNFPNCDMGTCIAVGRITICHKNIPNMISQFTKILGSEGLNIADMTNKSRGSYAYTIIDLESAASKEALDELKAIEGVSKVRVIK